MPGACYDRGTVPFFDKHIFLWMTGLLNLLILLIKSSERHFVVSNIKLFGISMIAIHCVIVYVTGLLVGQRFQFL